MESFTKGLTTNITTCPNYTQDAILTVNGPVYVCII